MKRCAVFLDRDGTIIEEVGYLKDVSGLRVLPRAAAAIRLLNEKGLPVIIATNQSGIARGYFTEGDLEKIHQHLQEELANEGAFIDAIYYCPHSPEEKNERDKGACDCRKPSPRMLEQAALDFGLELQSCYVVGDKLSDLELGATIGCKTVLVLTGYGEQVMREMRESDARADHITEDLASAVGWILSDVSSVGEEQAEGREAHYGKTITEACNEE